ncbi:MAG: ATP-binding protein [Roseiflexaceae bacterium]
MTPTGAETIRLDLPANVRHLHILSAVIAALFEPVDDLHERESTIYAVQLAAHEICANIVEHAYAGRNDGRIAVALALVERPRRMVVELYDNGRPFDPADAPEPDLSVPQTSGYGMFLVRNLVDEVDYIPERAGNRWKLVKYL